MGRERGRCESENIHLSHSAPNLAMMMMVMVMMIRKQASFLLSPGVCGKSARSLNRSVNSGPTAYQKPRRVNEVSNDWASYFKL